MAEAGITEAEIFHRQMRGQIASILSENAWAQNQVRSPVANSPPFMGVGRKYTGKIPRPHR
jgi:hypothetical protein